MYSPYYSLQASRATQARLQQLHKCTKIVQGSRGPLRCSMVRFERGRELNYCIHRRDSCILVALSSTCFTMTVTVTVWSVSRRR